MERSLEIGPLLMCQTLLSVLIAIDDCICSDYLGCANKGPGLSSKSKQENIDSHIPRAAYNAEKELQKSSSQDDDCQDDEDSSTKDKTKIRSLQTSIHKNLLRLFHKLKSAKPGSVMPDRKEFTNFASEPNQNGKPDNQVSTGVPLSKVRDGIKNASQLQDMNSTSTLKAVDKLVDAVLPNVSSALNNSNGKHDDDSEGGSGSAMDPKQFHKGKTDPYAAIAAGPDHPKLPPDLKITQSGSDGEAPPVVPVGMSDDSKGGRGNDEDHSPSSEGKQVLLIRWDPYLTPTFDEVASSRLIRVGSPNFLSLLAACVIFNLVHSIFSSMYIVLV